MKFPPILYYPIHVTPYLLGLYAMLVLAEGHPLESYIIVVVVVLPLLFVIERVIEKVDNP
jgi:uncharacterized membrane protein